VSYGHSTFNFNNIRLISILIVLLIGCSRQRQSNEIDVKAAYFKNTFLKKFKVIEFPSEIGEWKKIQSEQLLSTDPKTLDTLIVKTGTVLKCYGRLADTSRFYILIFYAPAVTYIPSVCTFDKKGNRIDGKSFDFGCWDGGPGEYSCDGRLTIDKEMNLRLDHVTTCYDCDTISKKPTQYFDKGEGEIKNDGHIEFEGGRR
jgi:hypothetical protein